MALDQRFIDWLSSQSSAASKQLLRVRETAVSAQDYSAIILELAPYLECFLVDFFDIDEAVSKERSARRALSPLFAFRTFYVVKHGRRHPAVAPEDWHRIHAWLQEACGEEGFGESRVAALGVAWQADENAAYERQQLIAWCAGILQHTALHTWVEDWVSFVLPQKRDPWQLVPTAPLLHDPFHRQQACQHRERQGFALTDPRAPTKQVLREVDYCVYCHKNEGDFCRTGFPLRKQDRQAGLKHDAFGSALTGCPLEEHISEMNWLIRHDAIIAPLAVVMIQNPLCPATGHRICNDCMRACIYQKQDPVDIPQIETHALTSVLNLPWGVEIYLLLTQWNPLRQRQYYPKVPQGDRVMVMGMGPSGFTLAHHLLMEGYQVLGLDGLKIERLPSTWITAPMAHYADMTSTLAKREALGFGGVSEYGITVRWDKNFLNLIYLSLVRRQQFAVYGGVRFGGTLTVEDAWRLGYDHLALAVGAGLPQALSVPRSMAPGMRSANDFLMALHVTSAAHEDSLASLQLRWPVVVIGGGLTAVDAATEAQAYYALQVQRVHARYHAMTARWGEASVRAQFAPDMMKVIDTQCAHAQHIMACRARGESVSAYLQSLGGVTLVYRKRMEDSPAYQQNHEELHQALQEGVLYMSQHAPVVVACDEQGHVAGLVCQAMHLNASGEWVKQGEPVTLPAQTILVATGSKPNVAYAFEHPSTFKRHRFTYLAYDEPGEGRVSEISHCKGKRWGPFTSYQQYGAAVSFIGDTHPAFHGSVVKAMASALRTYPEIDRVLQASRSARWARKAWSFQSVSERWWQPTVMAKVSAPEGGVWLTVRAYQVVSHTKLGHWFRLQRLSGLGGQRQAMLAEAVSAPCFSWDVRTGHLTFYLAGTSYAEQVLLQANVGDTLSVMGPTGVRTRLPKAGESVMLLADAKHMVQAWSTAQHMHADGAKVTMHVLCHAGDLPRFQDACAKVCHGVHWWRVQDRQAFAWDDFVALTPEAMQATWDTPLSMIRSWVAPPWTDWLKLALPQWREAGAFKTSAVCYASVAGPVQCALKGVCAQCLQWQIDPMTGRRRKAIFACSWQEQPIDGVDWQHFSDRQRLDQPMRQLNQLWWDVCQGDDQDA